MLDKTSLYNLSDIKDALINRTIVEVYEALLEKGYNPTSQIVGYLISGDPGYITNYKNARNKITEYERAKVLEIMLKDFIDKNIWDI